MIPLAVLLIAGGLIPARIPLTTALARLDAVPKARSAQPESWWVAFVGVPLADNALATDRGRIDGVAL